ncbi:hypothetical protein Tco_1282918 [Tanacetum coccineum]
MIDNGFVLNEEDEDDDMDVEIDEEAEEEHLAPPTRNKLFASHLPVPSMSDSEIPFPLSPPPPVLTAPPPSPIRSLGYRAATIRMRAEAAATSHSLPLRTTPSYSLPQTRITTPISAAAAARPAGGFRADYGFVATMDRQIRRDPERLGAHMREFESIVRRDTDEIYTRLDDEQGQRQLLVGRVNMLFRDRRTHAHTRQLMETSWISSQMSEIIDHSSDRRRQRAMSDYTTERDDSTPGTSHHTAGAGDSLTGTGDDIAGAGYCIAGIARTRWGSCTARTTRGHWQQLLD